MDELGRAMHYVGDAACTPHSASLINNSFFLIMYYMKIG